MSDGGKSYQLAASEHLCGSCTNCCTHLPIPAGLVSPGSKPAGVNCVNMCRAGCRIYSQRPQACVDFSCVWLDNAHWPDLWRPDRSGLLCLQAQLNGTVPASLVYETRPLALASRDAREILAELEATSAIVVVVDTQQRRQRIAGAWSPAPTQSAVPAPHSRRSPNDSRQPLRRSAG